MTVTLTAEEYYDLRKRAITPEQWQAKRERIKKAVRELIDSRVERSTFAGEPSRLPGQAHKFVDDVLRILEPEGDIYDPQNNPVNQRKETCPHS